MSGYSIDFNELLYTEASIVHTDASHLELVQGYPPNW